MRMVAWLCRVLLTLCCVMPWRARTPRKCILLAVNKTEERGQRREEQREKQSPGMAMRETECARAHDCTFCVHVRVDLNSVCGRGRAVERCEGRGKEEQAAASKLTDSCHSRGASTSFASLSCTGRPDAKKSEPPPAREKKRRCQGLFAYLSEPAAAASARHKYCKPKAYKGLLLLAPSH